MTNGLPHLIPREMSFAEQQSALTDALPAKSMSGLTMNEVKKKLEEEEEAKRKAAEEAAKAASQQALADSEAPEGEPEAKRLKRATADDEEDIDEDEQLMYIQAVQEQDEDEDADDAVEDPPAKRSRMTGHSHGQAQSKSPQKAQATPSTTPPTSLSAKATARPRSSLGSGPGPVRAKTEVAEMNQRQKTAPVSAPAAETQARTEDRKTWGCSQSVKELHLSDETCGFIFKVPSFLQKSTQQAKWVAEVVKQKPWLLILEKVLNGEKVTDQQFKSAFTAAKKVNTKNDKKVEYEKEENGEKLLTVRVSKLRSMLENLKELRGLVYSSAKQGVTIQPAQVEEWIGKVQADLAEVLPPPSFWIGYPEHWAQVGSGHVVPVTHTHMSHNTIVDIAKYGM